MRLRSGKPALVSDFLTEDCSENDRDLVGAESVRFLRFLQLLRTDSSETFPWLVSAYSIGNGSIRTVYWQQVRIWFSKRVFLRWNRMSRTKNNPKSTNALQDHPKTLGTLTFSMRPTPQSLVIQFYPFKRRRDFRLTGEGTVIYKYFQDNWLFVPETSESCFSVFLDPKSFCRIKRSWTYQ